MGQTATSFVTLSGRKISSFLLLFGFALLWFAHATERTTAPEAGAVAVSVMPDEGLRQIAQAIERRSDERKSGATPDFDLGLLPSPQAIGFRPAAAPTAAADATAEMSLPRHKLARAPPAAT